MGGKVKKPSLIQAKAKIFKRRFFASPNEIFIIPRRNEEPPFLNYFFLTTITGLADVLITLSVTLPIKNFSIPVLP